MNMMEDNTYVIHGPEPTEPVPNVSSYGQLIYDSLLRNVQFNEALIDPCVGKSIHYKELLVKSCALAEYLLKNGYGKDTICAICSENNTEFYIPVLAVFYIGGIMAPFNHYYTSTELTHTLSLSKPEIIFCSYEVHKKIANLKSKLNFIKRIIIIDREKDDNFDTVNSLISLEKFNLHKFKPVDVNINEQVALIMCSSGTTGLPKGVMITHKNLITVYMNSGEFRYCGKENETPVLGLLPFFHAFGLLVNLNHVLRHKKVVILKQFEPNLFLKTIQDYKISKLELAPPLLIFLAKSPLVKNYDLSCVKEIYSGAAPLDKDTENAIEKILKIKNIRQGYGLTESTLGVIVMDHDDIRYGSSGKVVAHMSCKVRDPKTGKSLGPGQVGELCFKGSLVMKGYINDKEATKNTFTSDGWLLTGDLAYYDANKYFFIVGRLKELIKYKGFQVPPAELEAILLTNPKIQDAGVIGLPKPEVGEVPLAFVVLKPNVILTEKEVQEFVAERVSSQKWLRGGVRFISSIPKSPSGKILRRELVELIEDLKAKL